jgi:hypothetical protein
MKLDTLLDKIQKIPDCIVYPPSALPTIQPNHCNFIYTVVRIAYSL